MTYISGAYWNDENQKYQGIWSEQEYPQAINAGSTLHNWSTGLCVLVLPTITELHDKL